MEKHWIKNFDKIAITPNRKIALEIIEAGLDAINTEKVITSNIFLRNDVLSIKDKKFDLTKFKKIKIVGFGKSSGEAALALEKILGSKISEGAVIGLKKVDCKYVETFAGIHPRPSEANIEAGRRIHDIVEQSNEDDLIIVVVSGGGSALLCYPENEYKQGAKLYDSFLKSGGTIGEMNTVRKHLSLLKGGGLARLAYPATVIGLIFSDVPGDVFENVASGPTYKDKTTLADAQKIITENNLGNFDLTETPKEDKYFEDVHNFVLVSNKTAVEAMGKKVKELDLEVQIASTDLYDQTEEALEKIFALKKNNSVVLAAGEPRISVKKGAGKGGRNLHMGLQAIKSKINDDSVFISFASDGMDNSEAAGGIADKKTIENSKQKNLNVNSYLEKFDSYNFFQQSGDIIMTGPTNANVSDVMILLTRNQNKSIDNKITKIEAEEIKDSRNNPTIKTTVWIGEKSANFSVPSGASTGINEAHELRDDDKKGVKNAIEKVNNVIAPALIGQNVLNQRVIDKIMIDLDGTLNKDNLGGNAIIGVSIACAKVAAKVSGLETFEYLRTLANIKPSRKIPRLYMNLINGGKHAKNDLAFQEYHIVPNTNDAREAVNIGILIQETLAGIIEKELGKESLVLGDEGGFAPKITNIRKPLVYLSKAIEKNNLVGKVQLALDVAASSFYQEDGSYEVDGKKITKEKLMRIYEMLINEFDLFSIEDPFDEVEFEGFRKLKEDNKKLLVLGDDLTVTNSKLLQKAIDEESINAMIIKPNQIGTLTETLDTMELARNNGIELIVSHRSGETDDDFIADLAFAFGCFGLKSGAPLKPERKVKYDRLIKISEE